MSEVFRHWRLCKCQRHENRWQFSAAFNRNQSAESAALTGIYTGFQCFAKMRVSLLYTNVSASHNSW